MTTRWWLAVVLFLAVFIAAVRAATRPIAEPESVEVGTGRIHWSDGVVARFGEVNRPVETRFHDMSALMLNRVRYGVRVVRWSDGSFNYRVP
jgi:hypothetical protein